MGKLILKELCGIDCGVVLTYQECQSCHNNDYCAEYEGQEICKKCFIQKSNVKINE